MQVKICLAINVHINYILKGTFNVFTLLENNEDLNFHYIMTGSHCCKCKILFR